MRFRLNQYFTGLANSRNIVMSSSSDDESEELSDEEIEKI